MRHEYRDRIRLLIGLESELIYPEILDNVQELIQRHSLDYIVGSVHHVEGIPIDYDMSTYQRAEQAAHAEWIRLQGGDVGDSTPTEAIFLRYFDLQFEMLQRLRPAIVGHFDLVIIIGWMFFFIDYYNRFVYSVQIILYHQKFGRKLKETYSLSFNTAVCLS